MPGRRKLARSIGPNADRSSGPTLARSTISGSVAAESWPSTLIEQPPAAGTFFDQSDWLPKVSGITARSPLIRAPARTWRRFLGEPFTGNDRCPTQGSAILQK